MVDNAGYRGDVKASIATEIASKESSAPAQLYRAKVRMQNPLVYDYQGESFRDVSYADIIAKAKAEGHDGVVLLNTYDMGPRDNIYVAFKADQIALAKPGSDELALTARQSGGALSMERSRPDTGIAEAGQGTTTGTAIATVPDTPSPPKEAAIRSLQQQSMDFAKAIDFPLRQGRITKNGRSASTRPAPALSASRKSLTLKWSRTKAAMPSRPKSGKT
jgi:hypothetical protein